MKKSCNTEEGLDRLSMATKDKIYINKDGIEKRVSQEELDSYLKESWVIGRCTVVSDSTREKIGQRSKDLVWVYNDTLQKCRRFKSDVVDQFLIENLSWKRGIRKL